MKTNSSHPLRLLYAALRMPKKDRKVSSATRNSNIITREESLNRIFMVKYRMQHL